MSRSFPGIVLLVLSSLTSPCGGADMLQLTVDREQRSYLLARPDARSTTTPTIIMLHGVNGTAERIAQLTGLDRLGPQQGFATVFRSRAPMSGTVFCPAESLLKRSNCSKNSAAHPTISGFSKRW